MTLLDCAWDRGVATMTQHTLKKLHALVCPRAPGVRVPATERQIIEAIGKGIVGDEFTPEHLALCLKARNISINGEDEEIINSPLGDPDDAGVLDNVLEEDDLTEELEAYKKKHAAARTRKLA